MEYWVKNHLFSHIGILLVTTGVVLIVGFSISSVFGQASTSMDDLRTEFKSRAVPLCGGEEVVFSGTVHFRFKDTTNPTGAFPQLVQMNYQDIKGVGVVSGDNYIVNEVNNFKVNQNPDSGVFHTVVLSNIVHLGQMSDAQVPNLRVILGKCCQARYVSPTIVYDFVLMIRNKTKALEQPGDPRRPRGST